MEGRVFIISICNFPRGSATANYIQYLAKAVVSQGIDSYIISNCNKEMQLRQVGNYVYYKNLKIIPLDVDNNGILNRMMRKRKIADIFNRENVTNRDVVITYFQDSYMHDIVLKLRNRIGFKTIACVTEWFPSDYFNSLKRKKDYYHHFKKKLPQYDMLFPISHYINDYFEKKGCRTFVLPIMADTEEYKIKRELSAKKSFIFPANGRMKDELQEVLKAFTLIEKDKRKNIELHLCGISKDTIAKIVNVNGIDELNDILIIHDWMKYDDLVKLYSHIHFLILARKESQTTLANFPSKVPETMTYGIVPIASMVGDYTKYYLKDRVNSIIINGCEANSIYQALIYSLKLTDSEYNNLSKQAYDCAIMNFDYRNWEKRIAQIIQTI